MLMNPDTRDMLNQIDEFLSNGTPSSSQLWAVLSALRGPDAGDTYLKAKTTEPVRSAAFPKTAQRVLSGFVMVGAHFAEPSACFVYSYQGGGHFMDHAARAASFLGIYDE